MKAISRRISQLEQLSILRTPTPDEWGAKEELLRRIDVIRTRRRAEDPSTVDAAAAREHVREWFKSWLESNG